MQRVTSKILMTHLNTIAKCMQGEKYGIGFSINIIISRNASFL